VPRQQPDEEETRLGKRMAGRRMGPPSSLKVGELIVDRGRAGERIGGWVDSWMGAGSPRARVHGAEPAVQRRCFRDEQAKVQSPGVQPSCQRRRGKRFGIGPSGSRFPSNRLAGLG
jgi:hypothetical protein